HGLFDDIVKRPYITAGFAAFLLLIPMGITSTQSMMKRLGRRWKQLHRSVYLVAVLACVHFLWQARSDIAEPMTYIIIFGLLFGYRLTRLSQVRTIWRRFVPLRS